MLIHIFMLASLCEAQQFVHVSQGQNFWNVIVPAEVCQVLVEFLEVGDFGHLLHVILRNSVPCNVRWL
jgi:hypothetical protein